MSGTRDHSSRGPSRHPVGCQCQRCRGGQKGNEGQWARAAGALSLLDEYAVREGWLDEKGNPRGFARLYVSLLGAERRALHDLREYLRERSDDDPLATIEAEGWRLRLAAEGGEECVARSICSAGSCSRTARAGVRSRRRSSSPTPRRSSTRTCRSVTTGSGGAAATRRRPTLPASRWRSCSGRRPAHAPTPSPPTSIRHGSCSTRSTASCGAARSWRRSSRCSPRARSSGRWCGTCGAGGRCLELVGLAAVLRGRRRALAVGRHTGTAAGVGGDRERAPEDGRAARDRLHGR